MSEQPSPDEILSAVQSSGYLMEQEVASSLEGLGLHVHTNRAFKDADEGKSRELDIAAIQTIYEDKAHKVGVFIELLCECKNSRNPFVFLLRPKTRADNHRAVEEILLPRDTYDVPIEGELNRARIVPALDHLGIRPLHYRSRESKKAVQFAKVIRDKSSWVANHAGLYDAVFYPLVKALISRRSDVRDWGGEWSYVWLLFPIVVTSGDIFAMDTGATPPTPEPVEHVSFVRHIKASRIEGHFAVDFVTQTGLQRHVEDRIKPFAEAVANLVRASPELFKKQR